MKQIKIILMIVFSIFLLLPLIFINTRQDIISEIDNRKLKDLPEFSISSSYLNYINKYFDDRYGGRELLVNVYASLNDLLFNELVHPSYEYGTDKYVFFGMGNNIEYSGYHKKFAESVDKIKSYVESKGSKFYMVINPEKTSVYTNYLPKGVNYNREWIEKLELELEKKGINYVDNTELLKEKSKYEFVYDKQYDAGHWNDLGAFYGVNNLLKNINKDFTNIKELEFSDFDISTIPQNFLKVSKFKIKDYSPLFTLKNDNNYEDLSNNYAGIKIDSRYPIFSYTKNNNYNAKFLPKALVFQGSYLNGREKFLKSRFSDYIAVHNYQNVFNIDYYYEIFQPDIVIFEVAEYTISDNYFSEDIMDELKF